MMLATGGKATPSSVRNPTKWVRMPSADRTVPTIPKTSERGTRVGGADQVAERGLREGGPDREEAEQQERGHGDVRGPRHGQEAPDHDAGDRGAGQDLPGPQRQRVRQQGGQPVREDRVLD